MKSKSTLLARALLGCGAILVAILGLSASASPRAASADAPQGAVDPGAIAALRRMGAFLRAQQTMWVQGDVTTDGFLPSGQKVQYAGTVDLKAQRPNRLRVELASDRETKQLFYDGTTFTVFQPTVGYYASFAAPPTLAGLVDVLEQRYGVDLPLADLFRLGTDEAQLAAIQRATMVGWSTVKSTMCAHYAFHQADVDWELWVQEGPQPLPRKLVVTTTTEKAEPQHVAVLSWNLAPRIDASAFVFTPPPHAQRIEFDVSGAAATPAPRSPSAPTPSMPPAPQSR
jgi:hypothetical protein